MRACLIICDHAAVAGNKLYINGGGWNVHRRPGQLLIGLAVRLTAEWTESNRRMPLSVRLMTEDGQPVLQGDNPIEIKGSLEFGRPA